MIPLVAGIVSGLLSAGSQVATYAIQSRQKEMERRYNSPGAQMNRLRAAGINPYGVQGQIAGQNTGSYPQTTFDFGSSFNNAVKSASTVKQAEMLDLYASELQQKIKGLDLDNQFKSGTLRDRMDIVAHQSNLAYLNTLYRLGMVTKQQYDNEIARINMEWQQYLAGIETTDFGDPTVRFVDPEKKEEVEFSDMPPKRFDDMMKRESSYIDYTLAYNTYEWKRDYEQYKTLKTEKDYQIACQTLIRQTVAADYENLTHMPFDNKDPWLHVIEKVISVIKKWPDGEKFSWKKLWEML